MYLRPQFSGFLRRSWYCRLFQPQPVVETQGPQCYSFHTTSLCRKKPKPDLTSEPYKFTTSPANFPSIQEPKDKNEYQPHIVTVSLFVFLTYFLYLREENDIDEALNVPLFERVPQVEEPHLAQAIPKMRDRGEDTRDAEARLKELVQERLERERQQKK